jgi:thiol-disulfide isomerase/thioredoxin
MKKILLVLTVVSSFFYTSCSSDEKNDGDGDSTTTPLTSITASSNLSIVDKGDTVIFSATGNNGVNLTPNATFYVDGVQISGNTYVTSTVGTIDVYATHTPSGGTMMTAATMQVTINNVIRFNKKVLIEDFTGTWCGYCPRVSHAIDLVKAQTSDAVVVAIHRGNDPYNFTGAGALENQIGLTGYPTAMLNRNIDWEYPETSTSSVNQAVVMTVGANPKLGIAMETTTAGTTSTVDVKVKFGKPFTNLKLVVYALENGLIYDQTNYTSYFGGSSTIANFEHNHVLRSVLTSSILGEDITGNTNFDDNFTKSFTYTIPSSVNASNVQFVAVVLDSNGRAVNSRTVGANEIQTFEIE